MDREDIQQAREHDKKEKARQKMYKDNKSNVRPHNIKEGDIILLERKTTKANSPCDPQPYTAEAVQGTQIAGKRGEEREARDSQKWKKMEIRLAQGSPGQGRRHGKRIRTSDYLSPTSRGRGRQVSSSSQKEQDKTSCQQLERKWAGRDQSAGRDGVSRHPGTGQRGPADHRLGRWQPGDREIGPVTDKGAELGYRKGQLVTLKQSTN